MLTKILMDIVYVIEVIRNFEPVVGDTVTMPGNVAVFDCHIPGVSYNENHMLPESVAITSWVQDGVFNIFPSWEIGEFPKFFCFFIVIIMIMPKIKSKLNESHK